MGLVVASLWHGILQRGGKRERADLGIELKTSLGNKKKTDTPTWHWGNKKRQSHTDFGQAQGLNSKPLWVIRERQTHQLGVGVIRKRQTHTDFAFESTAQT